ncbi:MAG: epoxyqueuosine reductase [Chloroflexota bacterium]
MVMWGDGLDRRVKEKAHELGADLASLAPAVSVLDAPSHRVLTAEGWTIDGEDAGPGWPDSRVSPPRNPEGKTIVVLGLAHPRNKPELDYFSPGGNTPGNSTLLGIVRNLIRWLDTVEGVDAHSLHYAVERGGVFLKDAAVLAGLGCIGRNNLLVTPEFGPRVRLRGVLVDAELPPDSPIAFDPCVDCAGYCRVACPRYALNDAVEFSAVDDLEGRPARDGHYKRSRCMLQMNEDQSMVATSEAGDDSMMERDQMDALSEYPVVHCRRCELSCPVGSDS